VELELYGSAGSKGWLEIDDMQFVAKQLFVSMQHCVLEEIMKFRTKGSFVSYAIALVLLRLSLPSPRSPDYPVVMLRCR
jgi:hypothetical protein